MAGKSDRVKLKQSKPTKVDGKYANTLSNLDRVMMSARREISNPKFLSEILLLVDSIHDKLKEELKEEAKESGR